MAGIRKINDKYYAYLRLPSGRQKTIALKTSDKRKAEANKKKIEDFEFLVKRGMMTENEFEIKIGLKEPENQKTSLKDIVDNFIEQTRGDYSSATITKYRNTFKFMFKVWDENKDINDLNSSDYTKFTNQMDSETVVTKDGKTKPRWNNTSINMKRRNLRHFLRWAIANQYIDEMPFKINQRKTKDLRRYITKTEFDHLLSASDNEFHRNVIIFTINTGLRRGELNHAIIEDGLLKVDPITNKTGNKRYLEIPDPLIKIHKKIIEKNYNKNTYGRFFKTLVEKTGLNKKRGVKITFHSLRHTFAYRHYFEYNDVFSTSTLLGHKSVGTTQDYYIINKQIKKIKKELGDWSSDDNSICLELAN